MRGESNYWKTMAKERLTRRQVLGGAARAGLGLAGLSLLGCAAAPAATPTKAPAAAGTPTAVKPQYGGKIIGAAEATPGMDPGSNLAGSHDDLLKNHIYNGLVGLTVKGEYVPDLAESWENPDKTTFIFKLRRGVKFHDGTDFNAQTLKEGFYDRYTSGQKVHRTPPQFAKEKIIKSWDSVDDYTVKISLEKVFASFFYQNVAARSGGFVASPTALKKQNNDLTTQGVGTGPFTAGDWVLDDRVSLKKFPGYWEKDLPYLDEIVWRIIPDQNTAINMLRIGDINLILTVLVKDASLLESDPNVVVRKVPGSKRKTLSFNMVRPPFDKLANRQAVAYAIDRKALADAVWQGFYPPGDGPFPPSSWAYDPNLKGYPYDPAKAKEKLAEAGNPEGFTVTTAAATGRPDEITMSEVIQAQLAKVGIKLNIRTMDNATWTKARDKGIEEFQMMSSSTGSSDEPGYLYYVEYSRFGRTDFYRVENKEMEALYWKSEESYNLEERRPYLQELAKLITRDVWSFLILAYPFNIYAYRKGVNDTELGTNYTDIRLKKAWLSK
ncbi:MAG: hypothetical protein HYU86_01670 [Chloroflexi bacterium]|nr:hypothetical protein [Chloroflexota bacterium]